MKNKYKNMGKLLIDIYVYTYNFLVKRKGIAPEIGALVFISCILFIVGWDFIFLIGPVSDFLLDSWPDLWWVMLMLMILGIGPAVSIWIYFQVVRNGTYERLSKLKKFNDKRAKIIGSAIVTGPIIIQILVAVVLACIGIFEF